MTRRDKTSNIDPSEESNSRNRRSANRRKANSFGKRVEDSSNVAQVEIISFGPYQLDEKNESLTCNNEPLILTPKAFSLLCYFVKSAGKLLTKDDLFAKIWPNVIVTDAALTVCVREIRKVLDDSSKKPKYIETVHKRGFRFIYTAGNADDSKVSSLAFETKVQANSPNIVGREKPLSQMSQCLLQAQSGVRQLLFLTGEPGIGKTSIIEEFLKQNILINDVWIAKGHCIEHYGASEAYLPLLDAMDELAKTKGSELSGILADYAPSWLAQLPAIKTKISPQQNSGKLVQANSLSMLREMSGALEAIAEKRLLILVLEDLHWADHATIDLLSFLARRKHPVRLLILGTYRPADAAIHNHPVKFLKQDLQIRDCCTTVALEFLKQQHIADYLADNFPENNFPVQFAQIIHQHTDGNPLFIVNLLSFLKSKEIINEVNGTWLLQQDICAEEKYIPDDLLLMINQQLEQLEQPCLLMLETASIASEPGGTAVQFTMTEVAAALDIDEESVEHQFEQLAKSGHFLNSLGATEWPDGASSSQYEFTHALYQNILYQRVSHIRKVKLHRQLGLCLEKGYGTRKMEIANQLAVHFELGRDNLRAVQYLYKVAESSVQRGANREAIHTLKKAQKLLLKLPLNSDRNRLELSLLLLLAPAFTASQGNATPAIKDYYQRAETLCEELGEQSEKFRVLFGLRSYYLIVGNLQKAGELAQELLDLADKLNDLGFLIEAHVGMASSEFFAGNHQASHQHALKGISLYDPIEHLDHALLYGLDPGVFCYARAGQTSWPLGYPDQAVEYENQAVSLAETLAHPYSLVFAIHNLTLVLLYRQDEQAALASAKRGKELALHHGFQFLTAWALHLTAWAYAMNGDFINADLEIEQALATDYPKSPATDSFLSTFLAQTYLLLGDAKKGLFVLETPSIENSYQVDRLYLQAQMLLLVNDSKQVLNQAKWLLKDALKKSRDDKLKSYELRIAISLSQLYVHQRSNREAYGCLENICHCFPRDLTTKEVQLAHQLLGVLKTGLGARKKE